MGVVLDFGLLNADYVNFPNDKKETRRGKSNVAPPYLAVPLVLRSPVAPQRCRLSSNGAKI